MANQGTLLSEQFWLNDLWPGYPDSRFGIPPDGFAGVSHHNVVAAKYPLGTKIQVPTVSITNSIAGAATMIYLRVGVQHADALIGARSLCGQASATIWHTVSNGVSVVGSVAMTPMAIALSVMTDAYYGWFWCGGNAPETVATGGLAAMGGANTYLTDDTVVYGQMVPAAGAGTLHYLVWRVQAANELGAGSGFCIAATDTAV